ncbi:beta-propeller domain-containing protein [Methanimicrococcus hongohii]
MLITTDSVLLTAYNVKDPANPKMIWQRNLEGNFSYSGISGGKFYTIVRQNNFAYPFVYMDQVIDYSNVYYAETSESFDQPYNSVYFVSQFNIETGELENCIGIIGQDYSYNRRGHFIYTAEDTVYLSNVYYPESMEYLEFIETNGADYFPRSLMRDIKKIRANEDFSDFAKDDAVWMKIDNYTSEMSEEESNAFMKVIETDYNQYVFENSYNNGQTLIVQIDLSAMTIDSGSVSGYMIDGYSADKKEGYLRVITTIGTEQRLPAADLIHRVYIFDSNMDLTGLSDEIVLKESITTARYIEDTIHIIHPNESSPRTLIDVSNPENPVLAGTLNASGYSAYLQPLEKFGNNIVLGVNQTKEDRLKIALINITNQTVPKVLDSYVMNETMSKELYHTFNGFMFDDERNILVIPVVGGVNIFEIKNNKFVFQKGDAHENGTVIRAAFVDDYLYTFSEKEIHVIDSANWETIHVISIQQPEIVNYERGYYSNTTIIW